MHKLYERPTSALEFAFSYTKQLQRIVYFLTFSHILTY